MNNKSSDLNQINIPDDLIKRIQKEIYINHIDMFNWLEKSKEDSRRVANKINSINVARELEELRRHQVLIDTLEETNSILKDQVIEALKLGASVNIDSNAGNINLTMNSHNIQQTAEQNNEPLDYEVAENTINQISSLLTLQDSQTYFGNKEDAVKELVEVLKEDIKQRKRQKIIKCGFKKLKELATGIESSIIATAILSGIDKIPGLFR